LVTQESPSPFNFILQSLYTVIVDAVALAMIERREHRCRSLGPEYLTNSLLAGKFLFWSPLLFVCSAEALTISNGILFFPLPRHVLWKTDSGGPSAVPNLQLHAGTAGGSGSALSDNSTNPKTAILVFENQKLKTGKLEARFEI
jgi:hypothetical protein